MAHDDSERSQRIVASRMKLRERFVERMANTPALSDTAPQGTGPRNRHGMPQLPVGQAQTEKWPVLDLGMQPTIAREEFRLQLFGACNQPTTLDWQALMALEQVDDVSDFHCVTKWSRMDIAWRGVRVADLVALAEPDESVEHIMCHGHDGYTTNVALEEALKPDVLLVYMADGQPLSRPHGGPVRMITPQLYAWKGAKWIKAIEFLTEEQLGFWEQRGYSSSAHPWRNDRYSSD